MTMTNPARKITAPSVSPIFSMGVKFFFTINGELSNANTSATARGVAIGNCDAPPLFGAGQG